MIPVELTADLESLRGTLNRYAQYADLGEAEIVAKQTEKLGREIYRNLRTVMPDKGSVRAEMLLRLASGSGVHVRQAAYQAVASRRGVSQEIDTQGFVFGQGGKGSVTRKGKQLNYQALAVQAELGLRESRLLSFLHLDLRANAKVKFSQSTWPEDSAALAGIDAQQQTALLDAAIRFVEADIQDYVDRKVRETIEEHAK